MEEPVQFTLGQGAVLAQRVTIINVFGHLNAGDGMLLETLVQFLRRAAPSAKLAGIAFDVSNERVCMPDMEWHERLGNTQSSSVFSRLRQLFSLLVLVVLSFGSVFYWSRWLLPQSQRKAVEALSQSDLVISCPGGYLEDSNPAYILNLLQILIGCSFGKKVILAPQSFGPIKSSFGRALLAYTLRRVDRIFVRERKSAQFISALSGNKREIASKTQFSGDLAFWYEEKDAPIANRETLVLDHSKPILGLTLVDWSFPHHPAPERAREAYLDALSSLVEHVERQQKHQIVIFNQVDGDLPIIKQFASRHSGIVVDWAMRGTNELSRLIGCCDIFIGTRFHSCIFSLIHSVPTVAIAYLPKTAGIMEDLELDTFVIDINSISASDLLSRYNDLSENREAISTRVKNNIDEYRRTHDQFFSLSNFEV